MPVVVAAVAAVIAGSTPRSSRRCCSACPTFRCPSPSGHPWHGHLDERPP